jgi:hypothetical protein
MDENYIVTQVLRDSAQGHFTWDVKILLEKRGKYTIKHEPIRVRAFPEEIVKRALYTVFGVVESFVPATPAITDDIGRTYYVCSLPKRAVVDNIITRPKSST